MNTEYCPICGEERKEFIGCEHCGAAIPSQDWPPYRSAAEDNEVEPFEPVK